MLIITAMYNRYCVFGTLRHHYYAIGILAAVMALGTINRNRAWESKAKLWLDSHEKNTKNPRALNNYAHALMLEERFEESIPLLLRSIEIEPGRPTPITNIAISYSFAHKWERADYYLKIAEKQAATRSETLYARGIYLSEKGDISHAIERFRDALSRDQLNYQAREELIKCLKTAGNKGESNVQEDALLRLNPDYYKSKSYGYK